MRLSVLCEMSKTQQEEWFKDIFTHINLHNTMSLQEFRKKFTDLLLDKSYYNQLKFFVPRSIKKCKIAYILTIIAQRPIHVNTILNEKNVKLQQKITRLKKMKTSNNKKIMDLLKISMQHGRFKPSTTKISKTIQAGQELKKTDLITQYFLYCNQNNLLLHQNNKRFSSINQTLKEAGVFS